MKLRDKLKYLSNRALAAGIIISALLALFACILILLANKEQAPWWCVGLFTAVAVLFPVTCWFWLVRPYFRCEQMMNRFLEGYLFSEKDDMELLNLTPATRQQMQMVDQILRSPQYMDLNKRQAQYLALQNQINPHFLYNTLESIRSEALIAGLVSVADMTEALATFFRYTISKVENLVSVEEELQNCMTYFKIQQYRFGDRLQLSVECDPEEKAAIYSCRIPKLTLQPILENSIIHGTECKLGTGHIRILLEMTESCLLLCISDDGNGMEERKVADINERLQKSGGILATGESETKGGIALVNVNNRIHLLFGEEYGIHVYSMPEIGTDVKIRIPVIYSDRNLIHMEERQENYC